jgi:DNA polymerase elongation subunit (family B)
MTTLDPNSGIIQVLPVDVINEIYVNNSDHFGNKTAIEEETNESIENEIGEPLDFLTVPDSNTTKKFRHEFKPGETPFSPYLAIYKTFTSIEVDTNYLSKNLDWVPELDYKKCNWKPRNIKDYRLSRRLYLDIETLGLDPKAEDNRIIMIGVMIEGEYPELPKNKYDLLAKGYIIEGDEITMITRLLEFVDRLNPDAVCMHNGMDFDIPFIISRCEVLGIKCPITRITEKERFITAASVYGRPIKFFPCYWTDKTGYYGRIYNDGSFPQIVDTLHLAGQHDKIFANMLNYGLKYLAHYVGFRKEKRLELKAKELFAYWRSGDKDKIQLIRDYLIFDLEDQRAVTNYFLVSQWYQQMYFPLPLQELCVASPARKHNANLDAYYRNYYGHSLPGGIKYNKPISDEKLSYGGGYVSVNKGLYKYFFKIDFSSLYPSIMLRYGLFSNTKDPLGVFLKTIYTLRSLRLVYKDLGGDDPKKVTTREAYNTMRHLFADLNLSNIDKSDKPIFKGVDNSLKVGINGGYGFEGTGGYNFNDIESAALVTAYGRVFIQDVQKLVSKFSVEINYDTDGAMCSPKLSSEVDSILLTHEFYHPTKKYKIEPTVGDRVNPEYVWQYAQSTLPDGIEIDLEINYSDGAIYAPKMKNYIYWENGKSKPKMKGVFRKRNRSLLQKNFPVEYIHKLAFESRESADKYFYEMMTLLTGVDFNKAIITQTITVYDTELIKANVGVIGESVSYYWGTRQKFTKTGKTSGTVAFPIKYPIIQQLPDSVNKDHIDMGINFDKYLASSKLTFDFTSDNLKLVTFTQRISKADKTLTGAGVGEAGDQVSYFWASTKTYTATGKIKAKLDRFPIRVVISEDESTYQIAMQDLPDGVNQDDIILELNYHWYLVDIMKQYNEILKVISEN